LEQVIRDCVADRETQKIKDIISQLSRDYAYAVHQPNARNGGLIGLAATAIALGQNEVALYLQDIIHPVLACFGDQDAGVRYYACESLYNISKVAKGEILLYFNEIFDVLCKLAADSEPSVKNGADLLDRLIKDIVCEKATSYISVIQQNPEMDYKSATQSVYKDMNGQTLQLQSPQEPTAFSLSKFIPLLIERINTIDPFTRVFLVSWITLLNSVPDLELISYLPAFLGGLLTFLKDSHSDVRVLTQSALDVFLHEIRRVSEIQKLVKDEKKVVASKEQFANDTRLKNSITITDIDTSTPNKIKPVETNNDSNGGQVEEDQADDTNSLDYEKFPDSDIQSSEQPILETHNGEIYIPGQDVHLDYPKIIEILISFIDSSDEKIKLVVLTWLETLLEISPQSFIQYLPKLLSVLLTTMPNQESGSSSQGSSKELNDKLLTFISNLGPEDEEKLNYKMTINTLTLNFLTEKEITKVTTLDWLKMLHKKSPKQLLEHNDTFTTLLKALSDSSEEVIYRDLQLISEISYESDDETFQFFMIDLLELFKADSKLLESRGNFILRRLCISLDPVRVYQTLAKVLEKEKDSAFVGILIQILNNNFITAPELSGLRKRLRNLEDKDDWEFFSTLFKVWCNNAPATLALCLLAQSYELAYSVLQIFVDFEITVNVLIQIDILVQLLESPVFTRVRLQLLEPEKYPYLYKCLYGILMLLPQSTAFTTLRNRLSSVSVINTFSNNMGPSELRESPSVSDSASILAKRDFKWAELLQRFRNVQREQEASLLKNRTSISNEKTLPKYSVTPMAEMDDPLERKEPKSSDAEKTRESELRSAVRKLSGRSFVLKGFGGDK
jgi:vacuole morphology and inheritance protein 14